jgi:hypothetical protein
MEQTVKIKIKINLLGELFKSRLYWYWKSEIEKDKGMAAGSIYEAIGFGVYPYEVYVCKNDLNAEETFDYLKFGQPIYQNLDGN